jgi:hypothetical protein
MPKHNLVAVDPNLALPNAAAHRPDRPATQTQKMDGSTLNRTQLRECSSPASVRPGK